MPIIDWDGSLAIGHEVIDAQHKSLVEIINRLHAASLEKTGGSDFRPVLIELYKYTLFHFNEEERLMKQTGYADLPAHKAEHEKFISTLDALSEKAKANGVGIGQETFKWLVGWLLEHISVMDKRLAVCLPKT